MNEIEENAKRADAMIAELAKQAQSVDETTPEVNEAPVEEAVDSPVEDQGVPVEEVPVSGAAEDAALIAELKKESAKWEQRYRSLDGMLQSRDRQINDLHQLIANMQAAGTPKKEEAAKKPLVTQEDEEAYGADLIDVTRRVSRDELSNYARNLEAQLAELQQQVSGVAQVSAETMQERFHARLTRAAPNWESVDTDPAFIQWLRASPTRYRVFEESAKSQDVVGVAQFFNDYTAMISAQVPTQAAPTRSSVDPRLARQVSPGKTRTAPPSQSDGEKRMWTQSGVREFFQNKIAKKYPKDEEARLEREAFAAMKEGRVDYTR